MVLVSSYIRCIILFFYRFFDVGYEVIYMVENILCKLIQVVLLLYTLFRVVKGWILGPILFDIFDANISSTANNRECVQCLNWYLLVFNINNGNPRIFSENFSKLIMRKSENQNAIDFVLVSFMLTWNRF